MEEKRLKEDYDAVTWAWKILKEHGEPQDNDEYWDNLIHIVSEQAHNENTLYRFLAVAILNEMDARHKRRRGQCSS